MNQQVKILNKVFDEIIFIFLIVQNENAVHDETTYKKYICWKVY